jgi:DNA-binding transcriptional regulator YdaS (Cro superfamily)
MKLGDYLKSGGIKAKSFAKMVGVTETTLRNIINFKRATSNLTALKIEYYSYGEVTCEELVDPKKLPGVNLKDKL